MSNTNEAENNGPKYQGLGDALSKQDFVYFNEELKRWVDKSGQDYKALFENVRNRYGEQGFGNQLDSLLLNIPRFALDKETNALKDGVKESVELLISLGAEPLLEFSHTPYGKYSTNFVRETAALKNPELLSFLFKMRLWDDLIDTESEAGLDLLHAAILGGSPGSVEFLIKEVGFDVNKQYEMEYNITPLFYAVGRNKEAVFDKLVELGANLYATNDRGENILTCLVSELHGFEERYSEEDAESIRTFNEKVKTVFEAFKPQAKEKRKLRTAF